VAVAVTPAEYAVEREFDDIAAVVSSPGEPVHLLDHSYGAFCALEAALRSQSIRSLAALARLHIDPLMLAQYFCGSRYARV
jgi:pimeloyl-ACP methyl ester carboxylesterase